LGLVRSFADEALDPLDFGPLEPLVRFMQETPPDRLLPELAELLEPPSEAKPEPAKGSGEEKPRPGPT
jgi:hypothetical protein